MSSPLKYAVELTNVGFVYRTRSGLFRHTYCEALTDVTFSLKRGETLGVIGRNGCGKSTLLRILSGIYAPARGHVLRHCKNISMLSLSVGFDPELSGEQNLILSSMLLGASKSEAMERRQGIVEFSGLEDFIDQPVKTYSSGMKARLGFSIGLKMNAEVMLIDEILGVGDESFKKNAVKAMKNRLKSQQSIVFVSHSLPLIGQLCDRVIWLEGGVAQRVGTPQEVIPEYKNAIIAYKGVGNTARNRG